MTFCGGFGVKLFSDPVSDPDRGNVPERVKGDGNYFTPISLCLILLVMELLIIQLLVFVSYVGYIVSKFGVLPSISDSWYSLPLSNKWLFTFFCWGIGIPMLLYGTLPLFFSGVGLSFVGAATQFKMMESYTKQVHFIGAGIGMSVPTLYFLSFDVYFPLLMQIWFGLYYFTTHRDMKNVLWWFEIVSFISIMLGLFKTIPLFYSL